MNGIKSDAFVVGRYQYRDLERAFAEVFGANPEVREGALRGRLKQLGVRGFPPPLKGPKQRRLYSLRDVGIIAVGLLLQDAGISADATAVVLKKPRAIELIELGIKWATDDQALPDKDNPTTLPNPVFLTLRLAVMADAWRHPDDSIAGTPTIGIRRRWEFRHRSADKPRDQVLEFVLGDPDEPGWRAVRNLTDTMVKLRQALPLK
jgi:hypothetical protein